MTTTSDAPLFEVEVHRDVRIPTADPEVTLAGDLYLPSGAGPAPLLLTLLPYRKDLGGADLLMRYFTRRGYASMIVDVGGTGSSDGQPRPPFSPDDAQDAIDAITWSVKQPWCDGTAGMWGHSYGGMTTMLTASRRPEALKAIIPVQGFIDAEVDFVHPDQARGAFGPSSWMAGMLGNLLIPPMHAPDDEAALRRWRNRLDHAEPFLLDFFTHGPGDPAWRERAIDACAIDVPALCFVGWRDLFADAQMRAYEAMSGPKRLIAGPWMHVLPIASTEGSIDFLGLCLAWWERWLKGVENGVDIEPSAIFVQGSDPSWAAFDEWPSHTLRAATSSDEAAQLTLVPTSAQSVPDPTVGVLSGLTRVPAAGYGLPLDQHDDDLRGDCWTSEPLERPVAIVGRPEVRLQGRLPGRSVVKLTHVDPAGRSFLITSGALGEATWFPVHPVSEDNGVLRLDATAYEVPAGHRIRVVVGSADFPRLWPVPSEALSAPTALGITVSLPVLAREAARKVDLPEEPEYLSQMLLAMAGQGPQWRVERELVTGSLVTRIDADVMSQTAPEVGPQVDSTSSIVASVCKAGSAQITCTNGWTIRWPGHPVVTVDLTSVTSDSTLTMTGRVAHDDAVTFEHTWSVSRPSAGTTTPAVP